MRTFITGGKLVLPNTDIKEKTLVIENGKISKIIESLPETSSSDEIVNVKGKWVLPGFIDIHTHGAIGLDTMDCDRESIYKLSRYFAAHGVTSFLPTTWSAKPELMLKSIENIAGCTEFEDGARVLGVHIEGPYLSIENRGAQLKNVIRKPDQIEYKKWLDTGIVKLITIAPEVKGAMEFIDIALKHGVEFAMGHTSANYEEAINAINHGVRQTTHLYNGMPPLHHRNPGAVGAVLTDDRIFAQVIVDGIHIHPAMINLVVRAKGISKIILITDSIRGTGLQDGEYDYHGQKFTVTGGVARTPEGGLSGSTLTLDQALRNMINFTGMPLNKILPTITTVPAKAMGLDEKIGALKEGGYADITVLSHELTVEKTFVKGKKVYFK
jgi:N-acetylglucosamine-6-phosphate deacetylase